MLKRGGSKSYSLEPIYDPKKVSTDNNGNQTPIENRWLYCLIFDVNEINWIYLFFSDDADEKPLSDYAKLMEPAKVRKRRYFSLAVICFTAFILALSISIVMTSAKPYLDLLSFKILLLSLFHDNFNEMFFF
jgi:hypothetical protein